MCSSDFEKHSKSIGFIIPLIPQVNRDSRLAYDIVKPRLVQFQNTSADINIKLTFPTGFERCTNQDAQECSLVTIQAIEPSKSV